jgi:outer membrane protein
MIAKVQNHIVKHSVFALPALLLAATAAFGQAPAQEGKVGIINIQGALASTKDGQKAASELEARAVPKRKELEGKESEINSLKDQLQKGANTLSETSRQSLARNIDQKTKSLKRDAEDAQAEWNQDQQKVLQQLGQRVMAVIDKYARDHGYTLILDVSSPQTPVLYASNTVDITKDIVEMYDKNSPGPVSVGGSAPSAAPSKSAAAPAAQPAAPKPAPPKQ